MNRPRVVLDTNVLVSALLFADGRFALLRRAWREWLVVPLIGRATVEKLLRVLAYPLFRLTAAERENLLADISPSSETVVVDGRADTVVSDDADLLALAGRFATPILTPADFMDRQRDRKPE